MADLERLAKANEKRALPETPPSVKLEFNPLHHTDEEIFDWGNPILISGKIDNEPLTREQSAYISKLTGEAMQRIMERTSGGKTELPMTENEEACFAYIVETLGEAWIKDVIATDTKGSA